MEIDDLISNLDWDPAYLSSIFDVDFNDMNDLWQSDSGVDDTVLASVMDKFDFYGALVQDSKQDDEYLRDAVEKIEHE